MKKKLAKKLQIILLLIITSAAYANEAITEIPPDSITHHSITIDGKKYAYTSRAGVIKLYENHKPSVEMFYTSETLDNTPAEKRPITFFYNGGPGASSMLLRIGSFGPKRIEFNSEKKITSIPIEIKDNPYSLLDKTDMVFIDMPGTGFGRLTQYGKLFNYYTVDNDADAFSHFIRKYLSENHRFNSPKFLFGESYGTTRTAVLIELVQKFTQVSGVILQSSIINYSLIGDKLGGGDWQYVLYLPSLAATSWYYHASDYHPESLEKLLAEVKEFAMTEYLPALAQGSTLSPEKSDQIAKKLHQFLGFSEEYIKSQSLRISAPQLTRHLLKNNQRLGRFDSRFSLYSLYEGDPMFMDKRKIVPEEISDPSSIAIKTAVIAANDDYLRKNLDYKTSRIYIGNLQVSQDWGFFHKKQLVVNASFELAKAMVEDPNLRVFSANGYYDLATPYLATIYTLQHLDLDPETQSHITYGFYEAGHMIYLENTILKQYKQDLAKWYDARLKR